jgi:hypothetical protein
MAPQSTTTVTRWHVLVSTDEPPSTVSYLVGADDPITAVFKAAVRHAADGGGEEVDEIRVESWLGAE